MKTTMILLSVSMFMLASAGVLRVIDQSRQTELRARYDGCETTPYRCIPPTVSFASLR